MVAAIAKAQRGSVPSSGRLTVADYLADWLDRKEQELRPTTAIRYRELLEGYVVPSVGKVKLAQLQPAHVERCMTSAIAKGLAPRTANHIRSALRSALSDAEDLRMIAGNAAKQARPRRVDAAPVEPMTPEEARAILEAVRGTWIELPVAIALWTGLREGEILGLRWRDLDRDLATISVRGTLHRIRGAWSWTQPKTQSSVRSVAVPGPLAPLLAAHRHDMGVILLSTQRDDGLPSDLVFVDELGEPMEATKLIRVFHDALRRAGLRRRRFHDLRHGAATLLLASGVDIKTVSSILGHSTIAITANLYAQVLPSLHRDAAEKMARLLG
jgi:integrase